MEKDNVSFKVYLKTAVGEQEVRRFLTERNTSTDYNLLMEKLWMMFPQLQDSDFSLTWTDSEGDTINVNTDEELSIALSEMPGEPYKLNLNIKTDRRDPARAYCAERGNTSRKKQVKTICLGCMELYALAPPRPHRPRPPFYENVGWQHRHPPQFRPRQLSSPELSSTFDYAYLQ